MDSKQVLARFEAERQAWAVMDHPNIAKILDGGMTDSGRPYFVMEYVKGVPFTSFCDQVKLSLAERLKLFIPVCHAVQHALSTQENCQETPSPSHRSFAGGDHNRRKHDRDHLGHLPRQHR